MKVNFVSKGGPHLASYRLRIASPAAYLRFSGVEVGIGGFDDLADCHVFSKHWDYGELELARKSSHPVFDVCDDHFTGPHADYYRAMCAICAVVTSSARLAQVIREQTGREAEVIPEPWELPEGSVKEPSDDPLILWFGHSANLATLRGLPALGRTMLCTNATGPGIVPYSLENLWKCLRQCDIVILPQHKDWKSANRMVESLRAGRFVVASDIPAYRGFDQYLGDIAEGVEWVRRHSGAITERIISGRNVLPSFSPEKVGEKWYDFISAVVTNASGGIKT